MHNAGLESLEIASEIADGAKQRRTREPKSERHQMDIDAVGSGELDGRSVVEEENPRTKSSRFEVLACDVDEELLRAAQVSVGTDVENCLGFALPHWAYPDTMSVSLAVDAGAKDARTAERPRPSSISGVRKTPGSDLLSHGVTPAVPSAVEGLTAVFGMGTGVSPLL